MGAHQDETSPRKWVDPIAEHGQVAWVFQIEDDSLRYGLDELPHKPGLAALARPSQDYSRELREAVPQQRSNLPFDITLYIVSLTSHLQGYNPENDWSFMV